MPTWSAAAPVKDSLSASRASSWARSSGIRVVGGEPVEQVVALGTLLTHLKRDGDRVLLDGLVRGLAADTGPHGGHQDLGGGQERQVAVAAPAR